MMTEEKAKEIFLAKNISQYTAEQLRSADCFIKRYALKELYAKMRHLNIPPALQNFILLCVREHFGSTSVDMMLTDMGCYPSWVTQGKQEESAPTTSNDTSVVFSQNKSWLFETEESGITIFDTEEEAYAAQRKYRASKGFNPITGEKHD